MRTTEPLRLALLGFLVILAQLAWQLMFPGWRAGFDPYIVFLLLVATARGPFFAGTLALLGGLAMDAHSAELIAFHTVYYLLPVFVGTAIRSQLIVEYNLLGTLTICLLLLGKIFAQWALALLGGRLESAAYLLRVNYWSVLLVCVLAYFAWRYLGKLIPSPAGVPRIAR